MTVVHTVILTEPSVGAKRGGQAPDAQHEFAAREARLVHDAQPHAQRTEGRGGQDLSAPLELPVGRARFGFGEFRESAIAFEGHDDGPVSDRSRSRPCSEVHAGPRESSYPPRRVPTFDPGTRPICRFVITAC